MIQTEIDCICCGAEVERHERFTVPARDSICDACTREIEATGIARLDEVEHGRHWTR